jgi:hypothetical protein
MPSKNARNIDVANGSWATVYRMITDQYVFTNPSVRKKMNSGMSASRIGNICTRNNPFAYVLMARLRKRDRA